MADSGGSDWEVVSLTASTYDAAPGPISPPPLHKTEFPPLLLPNPPAHFFMSQHFNLPNKEPLFSTHLESSGCQELEPDPAESAHGDAADADHLNLNLNLNMPRPENYCEGERDGALLPASPAAGNGLQVQGGGGGGEELSVDAAAGAGAGAAAAVGSAGLPAPAATVPVAAPPSGGVGNSNAAQAWWEKTFSFPRDNGTGPLAFRFVFVAGKLQIQEDQTKKTSCVSEPLGQAKVGMLGGSPVAQQG